MAEKTTSRPDEPLQQRSVEEAQDITPTGGPLKVSTQEDGEQVVTQQYHSPGTANIDPEDDRTSREAADEDVADTEIESREAARPTAQVVGSPEQNYYTRDNIVLPDPRPEVAELVAETARDQLGVDASPDDRFNGVQVDPTDAARIQALREVEPPAFNATGEDGKAAAPA